MLLSWSDLLGEEEGLVYVISTVSSCQSFVEIRMHYCIIVWAVALDIYRKGCCTDAFDRVKGFRFVL
jgi:hypothetical protein